MRATVFRFLIAAWVLLALGRAAVAAWQHRGLATTVWGRIRLRHVGGALGLLVIVLSISIALLQLVPVTRLGLGMLVDFSGNAVFTPLEAAAQSSPASAGEPNWTLAVLGTVFLGLLAVILPWLAFVEEEVFRAGLEAASVPRQIAVAVVFGAAHLVMLVPVAAALAIAAVGFVYGRIYRRAYTRATGVGLPETVTEAFRPTKRSARAADESRDLATRGPVGWSATAVLDRTPEWRQAAGVLASTVWHTTFNTVVVLLVWVSVLATAFMRV